MVEIYRVFWRPIGAKQASKNDTKDNMLVVTGLKEVTPYECVVKAGNHYGTSVLTEPVQFVSLPKFVTSASTGQYRVVCACESDVLICLVLANRMFGNTFCN